MTMMMKKPPHNQYHRHRTEIINQILTNVLQYGPDGISKTRVMYASELSSKQTREFIPYLVEDGLLSISVDENRQHKRKPILLYHVKTKGKRVIFLKLYDSMNTAMREGGYADNLV